MGSPSEDYRRSCHRSPDSIDHHSMHGSSRMMNDIRLSPHFTLAEFCNFGKYPANVPTIQQVASLMYGCRHLLGQAADIRPKDPHQFQRLVDFLRNSEYTDQLLTGNGWLHISWKPFGTPRHDVRIGYYK